VLIYDGGGFQNVVGDLDADFFVLMVVWRHISHRQGKISHNIGLIVENNFFYVTMPTV
jgi:hypothetical protein